MAAMLYYILCTHCILLAGFTQSWRDLFQQPQQQEEGEESSSGSSALALLLRADERTGQRRDMDSSDSTNTPTNNRNRTDVINRCCLQAKQKLQLLVEEAEELLNSKCALLFSSLNSSSQLELPSHTGPGTDIL